MLSVRNLSASFHTRAGIVRAVRNVSFDVAPGETLGIVGESGSGKSVTCYSIMGLIPMPPGRIESGSAMLDGTDLLRCPEKELRAIRGKRISMIFQDPMTSLNARWNSLPWQAYRMRNNAWTHTPTNSPAACASA